MPLASRTGPRQIPKCVPINSNLYFGFKTKDLNVTGISNADLIALGQKDPSTITTKPIVFGCNAPKGARFSKRITGGTQDSISSYGDGLNPNSAFASGWNLISPIRNASVGKGKRLKGIVVPLSNGLYLVEYVALADATAGNATLFGWENSRTAAVMDKLIRACTKLRAATVVRTSDGASFPCAKDKLNDVASQEGWETGEPEIIGTGLISAAPAAE